MVFRVGSSISRLALNSANARQTVSRDVPIWSAISALGSSSWSALGLRGSLGKWLRIWRRSDATRPMLLFWPIVTTSDNNSLST